MSYILQSKNTVIEPKSSYSIISFINPLTHCLMDFLSGQNVLVNGFTTEKSIPGEIYNFAASAMANAPA